MDVTTERETSTAADECRRVAPAAPHVVQSLDQSHGSFELVVSPLVLGAIGWWIDGRAGTAPWCTVALAVVGVLGASIKVLLDYRARMTAVAEAAATAAEARAAANRAAVADRERRRAELAANLAANLEAAAGRDVDRVEVAR